MYDKVDEENRSKQIRPLELFVLIGQKTRQSLFEKVVVDEVLIAFRVTKEKYRVT